MGGAGGNREKYNFGGACPGKNKFQKEFIWLHSEHANWKNNYTSCHFTSPFCYFWSVFRIYEAVIFATDCDMWDDEPVLFSGCMKL